jgi:hypothetical protein
MGCGGPKWKREIVADHKFDFIDTREFTDNGFAMRMKYLWLYLIVLKSFLVYVTDIFSAITMLTTTSWSNEIFNRCPRVQGCVSIPFSIGQWLFLGCIIFSFLLLAYESRKTKKIINSRDISYAFTNVMANHYYSLRSYDHFCFFDHISNSTKTSDDFAFFVFFVFKSWKRVLLADGPRQTINALTLWAIYLVRKDEPGAWYDVRKYFVGNSLSTSALTLSTFFTVVVFAGSLLLLVVAGICYVPLLCYIQGNLKEYCCHKVDKRIDTVIKRRQKQRLADAAKLARKEAMGDYSHLKNKKGELISQPLPQPTLPNLSVDDEIDNTSMKARGPPPSTYTQEYYYSDKGGEYPPMPAYNQPYSNVQDYHGYAHYNPSQFTLGQEDYQYNNQMYDDDNESTLNLTGAAAPIGRLPSHSDSDIAIPHYTNTNAYHANPHDVYEGRAVLASESRRSNEKPSRPPSVGLAYDDDAQDYPSPNSAGPPQRSMAQYANAQPRSQDYAMFPPTPDVQQHRHGYGWDEERGGAHHSHAI